MRKLQLIRRSEQVACSTEIASSVRATICDLRSAIERRASPDYNRTDRLAGEDPAGQTHRATAVEIKSSAGEAERRLVEQIGRKDVSLTQADDLLPQENVHQAERIIGWRMSLAVVHCVDAGKRIRVRK